MADLTGVEYQTMTLTEWMRDYRSQRDAYLFAETGDGNLYRIVGVTPDYWVNSVPWGRESTYWAKNSWCCHAQSTVFLTWSPDKLEAVLRRQLAKKRLAWAERR